jgi:hypothetical protein
VWRWTGLQRSGGDLAMRRSDGTAVWSRCGSAMAPGGRRRGEGGEARRIRVGARRGGFPSSAPGDLVSFLDGDFLEDIQLLHGVDVLWEELDGAEVAAVE